MVARTVHTIVSPFANAFQAALAQMPEGQAALAIAPGDADRATVGGLRGAQDPHLALLGALLTGQPQRPGETGIELSEVRNRANLLRDDLQRRLSTALASAGIAAGLEVRLRVNPDDASVEVVGNHSQRVALEGLFVSDPKLSQDFRSLAAISQLLQAADTDQEFAEMYAQNPWEAVARFPELFAGPREATFSFSPTGAEARLDLNVNSSFQQQQVA
jgi:hypothetical protein